MSNIKRGYPNPNYTEEDILTGKVTEENFLELEPGLVTVEADHYEELVSKAAALDILTADLKRRGSVNDDVVLAVTGAIPDHEIQEALKDKDQAWGFYGKEKKTVEEQQAKIETLQRKLSQAEEQLNELHRDDPDWPPKDEEVNGNE